MKAYSSVVDGLRREVGLFRLTEGRPLSVLYPRYEPETPDDYMELWMELRVAQPEVYRQVMLSMAWTNVKSAKFALEPRIRALLEEEGLTDVGMVHKKTNKELLSIRGISDHRLLAIRVALWHFGLAIAHAFSPEKGTRLAHPVEVLNFEKSLNEILRVHGIHSVGALSVHDEDALLQLSGDWRRETADMIRRRVHAYIAA